MDNIYNKITKFANIFMISLFIYLLIILFYIN
jgi:hypothetical protein